MLSAIGSNEYETTLSLTHTHGISGVHLTVTQSNERKIPRRLVAEHAGDH